MGLEVAAFLAVGLAGASVVQQRKANKEEQKARKVQDKLRKAGARRERLAAAREAQIAAATSQQLGANLGVNESSSAKGAVDAIQSTAAGNIGWINQVDNMQTAIASRLQNADRYNSQANTYAALANLSSKAGNL